jgi:hypothetical protein
MKKKSHKAIYSQDLIIYTDSIVMKWLKVCEWILMAFSWGFQAGRTNVFSFFQAMFVSMNRKVHWASGMEGGRKAGACRILIE